uniref:Integrase n=1 Tax=Magnetospirillum gryphiswaldense TaxID=55518 RepID=A4U235_9PROT|nr:Integrase [Magnetospirillum gryphiswaldense MSR-1]
MGNVVHILDGAVALYRREYMGTQTWTARYKIRNMKGYVTKATGKRDLEEAKDVAREKHAELTADFRRGIPIRSRTFKLAVNAYLDDLQTAVLTNRATERTMKDNKAVINRYLLPYFESKAIDAIRQEQIEAYKLWRLTYWTEGPGAKDTSREYMRGGKLVKAKRPQKTQTQRSGEIFILKAIFNSARKRGWVKRDQIPDIEDDQRKTDRRPAFTEAEWKRTDASVKSLEVQIFLSGDAGHPHVLSSGGVADAGVGFDPLLELAVGELLLGLDQRLASDARSLQHGLGMLDDHVLLLVDAPSQGVEGADGDSVHGLVSSCGFLARGPGKWVVTGVDAGLAERDFLAAGGLYRQSRKDGSRLGNRRWRRERPGAGRLPQNTSRLTITASTSPTKRQSPMNDRKSSDMARLSVPDPHDGLARHAMLPRHLGHALAHAQLLADGCCGLVIGGLGASQALAFLAGTGKARVRPLYQDVPLHLSHGGKGGQDQLTSGRG